MSCSNPRKRILATVIGVLLVPCLVAAQDQPKANSSDIDALSMGVIFNPVVRYTDTGHPVSMRTQTMINMARKIVEIRRRTGDDAEDRKLQAQRIAELEAKKKAVAERIAAGEKIVTKNFIIPGQTPETSRLIHGDKSGLRLADDGSGNVKREYVVAGDVFEDNAAQTCAIGESCLKPKAEAGDEKLPNDGQSKTMELSPFQKVTVTKRALTLEEAKAAVAAAPTKGIRSVNVPAAAAGSVAVSPKAQEIEDNTDDEIDEDKELTAEEIYRRYFPDAALNPQKKERSVFLRQLIGVFVPEALAFSFTQEDLETVREATERARETGKESASAFVENCSGCSAGKKIAPEQFSEFRLQQRQKARELLTDAEAAKALLRSQLNKEIPTKRTDETNGQKERDETLKAAPVESPAQPVTFVFISRGLGEATLKSIIERNAGEKEVTLVLRGVKRDEKLSVVTTELHRLVREAYDKTGETANIIIDPTLFERFAVTAVPTVVRAVPKASPEGKGVEYEFLASAKGLANDEWLRAQIEEGRNGDLGQQGSVYEIVEPDMIEEMKRRTIAIDWEAKKREALKRYWSNQKYDTYEVAQAWRTFDVDPTVLVTDDVRNADGIVIRKAGERINPLDLRPFEKEVIFFDATDEEQRRRVSDYVAHQSDPKAPYKARIYVSTRFDGAKGWDGYKELTDWLKAPLYQNQPGLTERFGVVRIPSVVSADNVRRVFVVKEIGPRKEGKSGQPHQREAQASPVRHEGTRG